MLENRIRFLIKTLENSSLFLVSRCYAPKCPHMRMSAGAEGPRPERSADLASRSGRNVELGSTLSVTTLSVPKQQERPMHRRSFMAGLLCALAAPAFVSPAQANEIDFLSEGARDGGDLHVRSLDGVELDFIRRRRRRRRGRRRWRYFFRRRYRRGRRSMRRGLGASRRAAPPNALRSPSQPARPRPSFRFN